MLEKQVITVNGAGETLYAVPSPTRTNFVWTTPNDIHLLLYHYTTAIRSPIVQDHKDKMDAINVFVNYRYSENAVWDKGNETAVKLYQVAYAEAFANAAISFYKMYYGKHHVYVIIVINKVTTNFISMCFFT